MQRIDIHQYFLPPFYLAALAERAIKVGAADLIREYPARFGAFAILPLPDVDSALRELEYALDTLRLDGVVLLSTSDGRYPGDPLFNELFRELQRRKAVVFLHPTVPAINRHLQLDLPPFLVNVSMLSNLV